MCQYTTAACVRSTKRNEQQGVVLGRCRHNAMDSSKVLVETFDHTMVSCTPTAASLPFVLLCTHSNMVGTMRWAPGHGLLFG